MQLVSRYWHITDGNGQVEEVRGPGVVGEQPELNPGDSYQYSSGCPLDTPSGIMFGHYYDARPTTARRSTSTSRPSRSICPAGMRTVN